MKHGGMTRPYWCIVWLVFHVRWRSPWPIWCIRVCWASKRHLHWCVYVSQTYHQISIFCGNCTHSSVNWWMRIPAVHHNRHNPPIPCIRIAVDVHCHRRHQLDWVQVLCPVQLVRPFNRRHFITIDPIKRCSSSSYAKNITTTKLVYRPIPASNSIVGHRPIVRPNEIHFPGILNCRLHRRRRYHRNQHRMMPIQINQRWQHASPPKKVVVVGHSHHGHCHYSISTLSSSSSSEAAVACPGQNEEEEGEAAGIEASGSKKKKNRE